LAFEAFQGEGACAQGAKNAVLPETFHGNQFVGDAIKGFTGGSGQGKVTHLLSAEYGNGT